MNDSEVIRSVQNGNRNDFRILVDKYQQTVFRITMGFVHAKEDAEDLTQEIFISAFQSLGKFRGDSLFSTWLHRIAVNACLNHTRNSKTTLVSRIASLFGSENITERLMPVTEENPEEIIIKNEHRDWLQKALESLPENQHTAIVLSKYDDMSQKEIAEIMNLTEGAVESLLQRAKNNLREKLSANSKKYENKRRKTSYHVSNE
jgi:RNA polymerase sigma-70 factor (ECF subfamily)